MSPESEAEALRAEVAALREESEASARSVEMEFALRREAERELAEARAEVAALREDVARITTLREITGERNAQLLKRAALRAEVAALRRLRRELAEARALLARAQSLADAVRNDDDAAWDLARSFVDDVRAFRARDEARRKYVCATNSHAPDCPGAPRCEYEGARDEAREEILEDKCHKDLGNVRPGRSARDEARRCTCGAVNDGSGIERHTRECLLERFPARDEGER